MALASSARIVRRRPLYSGAAHYVRNRRIAQIVSVVALIGMPIVGIFRPDVQAGHLLIFWQPVSMDWLVPSLIVLLMLPIVGFALVSIRSGRLFCSWWCPHGALNEAAVKSQLRLLGRRKLWVSKADRENPEALKRRDSWWKASGAAWWRTLVLYVLAGTLVPLVAAFGMMSYIVEPGYLARLMLDNKWADAAVILYLVISAIFILNFFWWQEGSCRLCPYGYLLNMTSYPDGAGARRNPQLKDECHGCSGCRDVCSSGLDPRPRAETGANLAFDECVSCGDCVKTCDDLTSRRGVPLVMELPPWLHSPGVPAATGGKE